MFVKSVESVKDYGKALQVYLFIEKVSQMKRNTQWVK